MADTSCSGALVPSVKSAENSDETLIPSTAEELIGNTSGDDEVDGDYMCPICMQMIKDAFVTACGHSYCYMCIITHLRNKSDCPCCGRYLTPNLIFPNFALDKLLKKMSDRHFVKTASSAEQLCRVLQKGCDMSIKDLDNLLSLLTEKKRKMEQEEAETNLQILLEFLVCLRKRKLEELTETQNDLEFIKEDIHAVQRRRMDMSNTNNRCMMRLKMIDDDLTPNGICPPESRLATGNSLTIDRTASGSLHCRESDRSDTPFFNQENIDNIAKAAQLQHLALSERFVARKRQAQAKFNDLQECYLRKRRDWAKQSQAAEGRPLNVSSSDYHCGLKDFQYVLSSCTRYSLLRVISELRCGDFFHAANIVSSIEFDRDDELFATAGVSKRIKVFEFSSVVDEPATVHCAVADIATRSKLSCLSWNKYNKHWIASSDYDGIVNVWDINTRQSIGEYEEHEKRAWSVDFSHSEPSLLVSGGDDCKVKVWCTNQEASVLTINTNANICSVKCNPGSSMHVAVGSADHHIHYYDLRNICQPVYVFPGHRKTVSYVKFLSSHELASASTDSTLRLWDVKENKPLQIYRGHTNERNFVGLSANSEYLCCGSETNEVIVYHKAISSPVARYRFSSTDLDDADEHRGGYFISAVCWKSESPMLMAANSRGNIRVLTLAA